MTTATALWSCGEQTKTDQFAPAERIAGRLDASQQFKVYRWPPKDSNRGFPFQISDRNFFLANRNVVEPLLKKAAAIRIAAACEIR